MEEGVLKGNEGIEEIGVGGLGGLVCMVGKWEDVVG